MRNFKTGNIHSGPVKSFDEIFETIAEKGSTKIERIISSGQSTPADEWYDQEKDEWVMLLEGSAGIRFEGDDDTLTLLPGDFIMIPAHLRHRVEWTDQKGRTLWLAVHF